MKILINGKEQDYIKAIQVNDYLVVVDTKAEIKENDFVYYKSKIFAILRGDNELFHLADKIIASTKFIDKSIPVIKFIKQSVEDFNLENAQKFAEKYFDDLKKKYPQGGQIKIDNILSVLKVGVECGYKFGKKYQGKSSDKKYTEKDIVLAMQAMNAYCEYMQNDYIEYNFGVKNSDSLNNEQFINEFIKFLNRQKIPNVINLEIEGSKLKTKSTPEGEVIEIKI
jgi:hypothetical protein